MGERQSVEQTEANPERSDEPPQLSLSVVRDEFRASASMAQKGFKGESSAVVSRAVADPKSSVSVKNIDTQVEVFDKNESVKKSEKKLKKEKKRRKKRSLRQQALQNQLQRVRERAELRPLPLLTLKKLKKR